MVGKGATHQRSRDGGQTVHGTNQSGVDGSLRERNGVCDNDQAAREDARASGSCYGTTNDQSDRIRCHTANERAELENADGSQEDPFDAEESVDFTELELEGTGCEKVGGRVPADIVEGMELVGNSGYGGRDDSVIQCNEEDSEAEADNDGGQLDAVRIVRIILQPF